MYTLMYLGAVEAGQEPLVRGPAVVYLSDLGQSVKVGVHGEVIGLTEACDDYLIMQVALFVH